MKHTIFGQFLLKPRTTGAILPSSRELSLAMVSETGIESASVVVELGPGTGAITSVILEQLSPNTKFFAIELNKEVIETFRDRFPEVKLYNDSASNIRNLLQGEGLASADVILSGLPWASFPDFLQEEILTAVLDVLPNDGVFVTFAYLQGTLLPAGKKFKKRLGKYFSKIEKSRIVWNNIPPAFVYRCRK